MNQNPAAAAADSQSDFLMRPPSGSCETSVLIPRAFHFWKLETGCEKTPMTNAGGMDMKGLLPAYSHFVRYLSITKWQIAEKRFRDGDVAAAQTVGAQRLNQGLGDGRGEQVVEQAFEGRDVVCGMED